MGLAYFFRVVFRETLKMCKLVLPNTADSVFVCACANACVCSYTLLEKLIMKEGKSEIPMDVS